MPQTLTFFATLRSPYSYLATERLARIVEKSSIVLDFRPVYPLAVRAPEFFSKGNPGLLRFLRRDAERVAAMNEIPFAWPDPDPIVQDLETGEIARHQPHIFQLTRLCAAACRSGAGFNLYRSLSSLLFSGFAGWHTGNHLAEAVSRAGLDHSMLEQLVQRAPDELDLDLNRNAELQKSLGHWGTPLIHVAGETFFGQDRLEMCVWHMKRQGLLANDTDRSFPSGPDNQK
ncbi:DsbA family protein [uncultured Roseibium sp.]|uniref:DsbA family protein n=1 Tax=uncultured Roseibium sp. TaxID=1936171 RepID=UPI0026288C43|nr:DsbA family protein [uncultured Roseibium sp.]